MKDFPAIHSSPQRGIPLRQGLPFLCMPTLILYTDHQQTIDVFINKSRILKFLKSHRGTYRPQGRHTKHFTIKGYGFTSRFTLTLSCSLCSESKGDLTCNCQAFNIEEHYSKPSYTPLDVTRLIQPSGLNAVTIADAVRRSPVYSVSLFHTLGLNGK